MRRALFFFLPLAVAISACGGDDDDDERAKAPLGGGLVMDVSFTPDPLQARKPVTWTLEVRNAGVQAVTLTFSSGQSGEVVLRRGNKVVYRWSEDRFFTEAVRKQRLRPNRRLEYELEEPKLPVKPGDYQLEATLKASPAPDPVREKVKVQR